MNTPVYLITLEAKRVNEQNTLWFCGGAHLMPAWGLASALGFDGGVQYAAVKSLAYVLHEKRMLGDYSVDGGTFVAQQRRGALTFGKADLNSKGQYPGNHSIQPVIESDSTVSVLVQYDTETSESKMRRSLASSRFGGGRIQSFEISRHDGFAEALRQAGGYAFEVLPDLVDPNDPVDSIVDALCTRPISFDRATLLGVDRPSAFVSPCVVGYELISPITAKINVREGLMHGFVEPVSTLGRYVGSRLACGNPDLFTLTPEWKGSVFHLGKQPTSIDDFIL